MPSPNILCAGTYHSLQVARSLVLRQAGYKVEIATSRNAAVVVATERQFAVTVICDSFPPEEAAHLARDLETVSPHTRVLLLDRFHNGEKHLDSPEFLLALVRRTLAQPADSRCGSSSAAGANR